MRSQNPKLPFRASQSSKTNGTQFNNSYNTLWRCFCVAKFLFVAVQTRGIAFTRYLAVESAHKAATNMHPALCKSTQFTNACDDHHHNGGGDYHHSDDDAYMRIFATAGGFAKRGVGHNS